jgi:hypothetical protein
MKKLISISVFFSLLFLFYSHAPAEVPQMINYQGKLTTNAGAPVNDTLPMVFSIYPDSVGGTALWTETQSAVIVEKGVFNVLLGSVDSIPYSVFDGSTRYLGVKVGDDPEITPRKPMVSVAYAMRAGSSTPADYSVSQAKLKTAIGEVSYTGGSEALLLPGGEYVFRSQYKAGQAQGVNWIFEGCGDPGWNIATIHISTSYTGPWVNIGCNGSGTGYAQARYVTASGKDHWVFLLLDKETKRVIAGYQAPDHPCHGQGGDENDIPHPFGSYDPAKHEVILVDNDILPELRSKVTSKRSLLTVINEDYEIDFNSHPVYKPREIIEIDEYGDKEGEIIKKIETPEWAKILIGKDEIYLKRRLVETLPSYISYKKLKPKWNVIAESPILSKR